MEILYLILGWLLGLLSPQISERISRHYKKRDLRIGLISELKEIRYRLILTTYLLSKKAGSFNKDLIEWVRKQLEDYKERDHTKMTLSVLEKLSADPSQIAVIRSLSYDEETGLSLKKFYLPFIEAKTDFFPVFGDGCRNLLFQIRFQIQALNEEIDNVLFYFRKTFDSSMSPVNHEIVRKNLTHGFENLARQTKLITEKINDLLKTGLE